ncbi:hypothetical protein QQ045_008047 [Rhodiola kirilowii]
MYEKYDVSKKDPEKRTRIKIRMSRVADGLCLQVELGFEGGSLLCLWCPEGGVNAEEGAAEDAEGILVVTIGERRWRMIWSETIGRRSVVEEEAFVCYSEFEKISTDLDQSRRTLAALIESD